jgi:hypothetical protein
MLNVRQWSKILVLNTRSDWHCGNTRVLVKIEEEEEEEEGEEEERRRRRKEEEK